MIMVELRGKPFAWEPVGRAKKHHVFGQNLIAMDGTRLDRLLKQRFALRRPDNPFDSPPQRGGLRCLSGGAGCVAPESRAPSELLS
jgi:hypothetical protein